MSAMTSTKSKLTQRSWAGVDPRALGRGLCLCLCLGLALGCSDDGGRGEAGSSATLGLSASVSASASASASASGTGGSAATDADTGGDESVGGSESGDGETGIHFDIGVAPDVPGGDACVPPDVLVVLDRSQSMHRKPNGDTPPDTMAGYSKSRWWIALEALQAFVGQFEGGMRLGLEMFPAPAPKCVTLAERIGGKGAGNDGCGTTEMVVSPTLGAAAEFDAALDPLTTLLCNQTPISSAIAAAAPILTPLADDEHEQYVILVTDGGESCGGDFVGETQGLVASLGLQVYVVAFGDAALTGAHNGLNRLACAGRTAAGFPGPCVDTGNGKWDAKDPAGPALYIPAEDGAALAEAFDSLAAELCCGMSCPPS